MKPCGALPAFFGLCGMISQMKPGLEICGRNQLLLHGRASANAPRR
jgi:hypothetical protein